MKKAVKYDEGKTDWLILPNDSLQQIVKALKYGEKKYSRGNFAKGKGLKYSRLLNSLLRHIYTFANPNKSDIDKESGIHHLALAGANILMLLYFVTSKTHTKNDDRLKEVL